MKATNNIIGGIFNFSEDVCAEHGEYSATWVRVEGKRMGGECPACAEERGRLEKHAADAQWTSERKAHLMKISHIPKLYQSASLEKYQPVCSQAQRVQTICARYVETWGIRREEGSGLIFTGNMGTGKTHLACAIMQELMTRYGVTALYTSVLSIMRDFRKSYQKGAEITESQIIERLFKQELLVIDELGIGSSSDHEHTKLFDIINQRYEECLPTILISNLGVDELSEAVGERTVDRVRERGVVMTFTWESFRRSVA